MSETKNPTDVIVDANIKQGFAGAFAIGTRADLADPARSRLAYRFAVWSAEVFKNGRQPEDQPHLSAFLPRRFDRLERIPLTEGNYELLRPIGETPPGDGNWIVSVRTSLHWLGLRGVEIAVCIQRLR